MILNYLKFVEWPLERNKPCSDPLELHQKILPKNNVVFCLHNYVRVLLFTLMSVPTSIKCIFLFDFLLFSYLVVAPLQAIRQKHDVI